MDTKKPSTTTNVPLHLDPSPKLKSTEIGPLSLEMFNCAATDLDDRGEINLKKYNKYLIKKSQSR